MGDPIKKIHEKYNETKGLQGKFVDFKHKLIYDDNFRDHVRTELNPDVSLEDWNKYLGKHSGIDLSAKKKSEDLSVSSQISGTLSEPSSGEISESGLEKLNTLKEVSPDFDFAGSTEDEINLQFELESPENYSAESYAELVGGDAFEAQEKLKKYKSNKFGRTLRKWILQATGGANDPAAILQNQTAGLKLETDAKSMALYEHNQALGKKLNYFFEKFPDESYMSGAERKSFQDLVKRIDENKAIAQGMSESTKVVELTKDLVDRRQDVQDTWYRSLSKPEKAIVNTVHSISQIGPKAGEDIGELLVNAMSLAVPSVSDAYYATKELETAKNTQVASVLQRPVKERVVDFDGYKFGVEDGRITAVYDADGYGIRDEKEAQAAIAKLKESDIDLTNVKETWNSGSLGKTIIDVTADMMLTMGYTKALQVGKLATMPRTAITAATTYQYMNDYIQETIEAGADARTAFVLGTVKSLADGVIESVVPLEAGITKIPGFGNKLTKDMVAQVAKEGGGNMYLAALKVLTEKGLVATAEGLTESLQSVTQMGINHLVNAASDDILLDTEIDPEVDFVIGLAAASIPTTAATAADLMALSEEELFRAAVASSVLNFDRFNTIIDKMDIPEDVKEARKMTIRKARMGQKEFLNDKRVPQGQKEDWVVNQYAIERLNEKEFLGEDEVAFRDKLIAQNEAILKAYESNKSEDLEEKIKTEGREGYTSEETGAESEDNAETGTENEETGTNVEESEIDPDESTIQAIMTLDGLSREEAIEYLKQYYKDKGLDPEAREPSKGKLYTYLFGDEVDADKQAIQDTVTYLEEDPQSMQQVVDQGLMGGARFTKESLISELGLDIATGGERAAGEVRTGKEGRDQFLQWSGGDVTIQQYAETLVNDNPGLNLDEGEVRNAIIETLRDSPTKGKIREAITDRVKGQIDPATVFTPEQLEEIARGQVSTMDTQDLIALEEFYNEYADENGINIDNLVNDIINGKEISEQIRGIITQTAINAEQSGPSAVRTPASVIESQVPREGQTDEQIDEQMTSEAERRAQMLEDMRNYGPNAEVKDQNAVDDVSDNTDNDNIADDESDPKGDDAVPSSEIEAEQEDEAKGESDGVSQNGGFSKDSEYDSKSIKESVDNGNVIEGFDQDGKPTRVYKEGDSYIIDELDGDQWVEIAEVKSANAESEIGDNFVDPHNIFINEQKESDVPSTTDNLESDSDSGESNEVSEESENDDSQSEDNRSTDGQGSGDVENTGSGEQGDSVVSGPNAIDGIQSDPSIPTIKGEAPVSNPKRPGQLDIFGPAGIQTNGQTGSEPTEADHTAEPLDGLTFDEKVEIQRNAPTNVIKGDIKNIRKSLPLLYKEQQEDVQLAEERLAEHKGILFTNETGTGKTFTGGGIARRFWNEGKREILVVTPSQEKVRDWVNDMGYLGMEAEKIKNKNDGGSPISKIRVTTFANFSGNENIHNRDWDLVIYDESHRLSGSFAKPMSKALMAHRKTTNSPSQVKRWAYDEINRITDNVQRKIWGTAYDEFNDPQNYRVTSGYDVRRKIGEEKWKEYTDTVEEIKRDVNERAIQKNNQTKVVFLSATAFSYAQSLHYADGYLFEANETMDDLRGDGMGYNEGDKFQQFMVDNFGYRMRYNKLTQPGPEVNQAVLQRLFGEKLKREKALSFRKIDVPFDYSRQFIKTTNPIVEAVEEAYRTLMTAKDNKGQSRFPLLAKQFTYHVRNQILEGSNAATAIDRIKDHLKMGRQIVVFHAYKKKYHGNPFRFVLVQTPASATTDQVNEIYRLNKQIKDWNTNFSKYSAMEIELDPVQLALEKAFKGRIALFNGDVKNKDKSIAVDNFNDPNSPIDIIVVNKESGKEGISLHDKLDSKPRVLMQLGIPNRPADLEQTEGRIRRLGVKSNTIFEYITTQMSFERSAFVEKVAGRAGFVENVSKGNAARGATQMILDAYNAAEVVPVSENQGIGGLETEKAIGGASPFEIAHALYYAKQKKRKNHLGKDYFATPEPIGFSTVRKLDMFAGDRFLEPSAGDGAIARFAPDLTQNTFVEQSYKLFDKLNMNVQGQGKLVNDDFMNFNIVNKFEGIAMNPPFGHAGTDAIKHLDKAWKHLVDRGRLALTMPMGAAISKLDKWLAENKNARVIATIQMPGITFNKAGTGVASQIVFIDKYETKRDEQVPYSPQERYSLVDVTDVNELFKRFEDITIPERMIKEENYTETRSPFTDEAMLEDVDSDVVWYEKEAEQIAQENLDRIEGEVDWDQVNLHFNGMPGIPIPKKLKEQMKEAILWLQRLGKNTYENFVKFFKSESGERSLKFWKKTTREIQGGDLLANKKFTILDEMIRTFQDKDRALDNIVKEIKVKNPNSKGLLAYIQKELSNSIAYQRTQSMKEQILGKANAPVGSKINKVSLKGRLEAAGLDWETFKDFVYAQHAEERNKRVREMYKNRRQLEIDNIMNNDLLDDEQKRDRILALPALDIPQMGSGMSDAEAQAILNSLDRDQKWQYEEFAQEFRDKVVKGRVEALYEGGLINADQYETLMNGKREGYDDWNNYIPLLVDKEFLPDDPGQVSDEWISADVKKLTGTDKYKKDKRYDPVMMSMVMYGAAQRQAQGNIAKQEVARLIAANPEKGVWGTMKARVKPRLNALNEVVNVDNFTPKVVTDNGIAFKIGGQLHYFYAKPFEGQPVHPLIASYKRPHRES